MLALHSEVSGRIERGRITQKRQAVGRRNSADIRGAALECGSLLPLWPQPACWLAIAPAGETAVSKLAGEKAAASCRTPKLRTPEPSVVALGLLRLGELLSIPGI